MSTATNSTGNNGTDATGPLPDPDVAGPGVVLGFALTGLLTLIVSELTISLRKLDDPEYMKHLRATTPGPLSIKRYWRRLLLSSFGPLAIWLAPKNSANPVKFWISTLEHLTLNLADQQLITGLLVIVLGLIKYLPHYNNLNSFDNAQAAVMFSAVTHLASVRTLRSYLRKHYILAVARLLIVGLTFLLIIGTHVWFLVMFERARNPQNPTSYQIAILTWLSWDIGLIVFLSDSALAARRAFDTSKSGRLTIILWMESMTAADRHGASRKFRNPVTATALWLCRWYIAAGTTLSFCIICLAELLFPWVILSYILWAQFFLSLFMLISYLPSTAYEDYGNFSNWGFGQLLSIFVVLLPFFTLMEKYSEESKQKPDKAADPDSWVREHLASAAEELPQSDASSRQLSSKMPRHETYYLIDDMHPTGSSHVQVEYHRITTALSLAESPESLITHDYEREI